MQTIYAKSACNIDNVVQRSVTPAHFYWHYLYNTLFVFIIVNVQYSFAHAHHYIDPQSIYFTPHTHLEHTDTEGENTQKSMALFCLYASLM